jgi:hypothetical protein
MAVVLAVPTVRYCGRDSYGLNVNTDWVAVARFRAVELLLAFMPSLRILVPT